MKYAQIIMLTLLIFVSCTKRDIKTKSILHCNGSFITHSIFAWNEKMTNENCGSSVAKEFNNGMNLIYGVGQMTTSHQQTSPLHYNDSYWLDNFNNNSQLAIKEFLAPKEPTMSIVDSLSFDKKMIFTKNDKVRMSTKLKLILYKIQMNGNFTWILSKIIHEDFHANEKGFASPIFKYNYQVYENDIYSYFKCFINVDEGTMNMNAIPIVLNNIRVENDAILYDDITKKVYADQFKGDYKVTYE